MTAALAGALSTTAAFATPAPASTPPTKQRLALLSSAELAAARRAHLLSARYQADVAAANYAAAEVATSEAEVRALRASYRSTAALLAREALFSYVGAVPEDEPAGAVSGASQFVTQADRSAYEALALGSLGQTLERFRVEGEELAQAVAAHRSQLSYELALERAVAAARRQAIAQAESLQVMLTKARAQLAADAAKHKASAGPPVGNGVVRAIATEMGTSVGRPPARATAALKHQRANATTAISARSQDSTTKLPMRPATMSRRKATTLPGATATTKPPTTTTAPATTTAAAATTTKPPTTTTTPATTTTAATTKPPTTTTAPATTRPAAVSVATTAQVPSRTAGAPKGLVSTTTVPPPSTPAKALAVTTTLPTTSTTLAPPSTTVPPTTTTVPHPATPAGTSAASAGGHPPPAGGVWLELRECESGDNYQENTGNGFYGAYQFAWSTWTELGFPGRPDLEPYWMQDEAAQKLQAEQGWSPWPACSAALGL